jgi:hypothetical protein
MSRSSTRYSRQTRRLLSAPLRVGRTFLFVFCGTVATGCMYSDFDIKDKDAGVGGHTSSGGTTAKGGTSSASNTKSTSAMGGSSQASGGTTNVGGSTALGGSASLGGTVAVGGSSAAGGATGGTSANGGATSSGATQVNGGATQSIGGTMSSVGTPPVGGVTSAAGSTGTGGAPPTGGAISAGGTIATGGGTDIGGTGDTSSAGATSTGGTVTSGGSVSTTDTNATGGTTTTGGTGCAPGSADCDGAITNGCETNTTNDASHCGDCNTVCAFSNAAAHCSNGACAMGTCNSGYADCDSNVGNGCEVNRNTDKNNCGSCNISCAFSHAAASCVMGACTMGDCDSDYANCDVASANGCESYLKSDVGNCNACGNNCPNTGGMPVCNNGSCGYSACFAPYQDCNGGTGCVTNLSNDANHCGSCNNKCSFDNATASCVGGTCTMTCSAGFEDCDGNKANGCEVNTTNNVNYCGNCSNKCSFANAASGCVNGVCTVVACNTGYADCDGAAANGCEINLKTEVDNCNSCGAKCSTAGGTASCTNGVCGTICDAGRGNCDGSVANGCEANTTADVNNCGGCGNVCNSTHGTASCASGTCSIVCGAGYGDCANGAADGCESNLNSNPNHCGNCGTACTYAHAGGVCNSGICQPGTCDPSYGNCDAVTSNGCEVSLNTASNCLTCGATCTNANGTTTCGTGGCTPTCSAGYMSCDSNPNNGCEQNVVTDVNHCGSCTSVCSYANATPVCSGGTCSMGACSYLYGNCNGSASDGCEKNVNADTSNCGACGNVCSSANGTAACSNGACSISCNTLWGNCDGSLANGCERDLSGDASNCGSCGHTCPTGQSCISGSCGGPCYSICSNPTAIPRTYSLNPVGTGAGCFEQTNLSSIGYVCGNFSPRIFRVNGNNATCNGGDQSASIARYGGFCFSFDAGNPSIGYFQTY